MLDSLLLASVIQLSTRIRQSVDKTACKIRWAIHRASTSGKTGLIRIVEKGSAGCTFLPVFHVETRTPSTAWVTHHRDSTLHILVISTRHDDSWTPEYNSLQPSALTIQRYVERVFVCRPFIYFCTALASRILFKDKERKWEEIETKLQAEHDSLLLKSSNKVTAHVSCAK